MSRIFAALLVLAFAFPAAAQEAGGLPLAPGVGKGPTGLARLMPSVLPNIGASDVQSSLLGNAGSIGQSQAGALSTGLNGAGVGGGGFGGGGFDGGGSGGQQVIINKTINRSSNRTINGPVAFTNGNNNTVQIQSANGSGPIALQQVNTVGGSGGNNVNSALGGPARGNATPANGGFGRLAPGGGNTNSAAGGRAARTAMPHVDPIRGAGVQVGGTTASGDQRGH
jgi:hypothetical protein